MNQSLVRSRTIRIALVAIVAVLSTTWLKSSGLGPWGGASDQIEIERISFNKDIRPIFNSKCVACHGGVTKQGGISYIFREEALQRGNSGRLNVVPNKPHRSELIARVTSEDPLRRMPYGKDPLSEDEVFLLEQWIEEGAEWEDHWAFIAPKKESVPQQAMPDWGDHPVDAFVGIKLGDAGLHPTQEANKARLLRRLSLDMTGLPPTPTEIKAFAEDNQEGAYERQVDRLFDSTAFGEKWASMWLDLARYADSMGYVRDLKRDSWPYRDWVIDAYNENMPYDEFVRLQIAGDMIEGAGFDGLIASSFHRQTPTNLEGGSDNEEYRMVAVMDRVATTWSVLNGMTMGCVQCHSHPYDPILHRDYYASLAFFNNSRDYDLVDDEPTVRVPVDEQQRSRAYAFEQKKSALIDEFIDKFRTIDEATAWSGIKLQSGVADKRAGWQRRLQLIEAAAEREKAESQEKDTTDEAAMDAGPRSLKKLASDARFQLEDPDNSIIRADIVDNVFARFPSSVPPIAVYELIAEPAAAEISAFRIDAVPLDAEKALHTPESGFAIEEIVVAIRRSNGDEEVVALAGILSSDSDSILQQHANNFARALEDSLTVSGYSVEKLRRQQTVVLVPEHKIELEETDSLVFRLSQAQLMRFRQPPPILRQLRVSFSDNSRWLEWASEGPQDTLTAGLDDIESKIADLPGANLPVMSELPPLQHPATLVFERGDMSAKTGDILIGDVPDVFPPMPGEAPRDRLEFADWFFADDQPLTARVAVNRFWEQFFGRGLVETMEDFGSGGLPPSHPELLDWLAWQFQHELNWDRKAIVRTIVTSRAYRQSANCDEANRRIDPDNMLLSCGTRRRLSAEMVRDQALTASGLLSNKVGGSPVMPPQPPGIWNSFNIKKQWIESTGAERSRRAIYTYFKQSSPYPSFIIFDHSTRDVSTARRLPTNTPLQALVLLNDPVYVEAGAALARVMSDAAEAAESIDAGFSAGYQRVTSEEPDPVELKILRDAFDAVLEETGARTKGWRAAAMVVLNADKSMTR